MIRLAAVLLILTICGCTQDVVEETPCVEQVEFIELNVSEPLERE